ncbi:hypothetical protein JL720_2795 [Aureococcus anophagefferens]|nr:hypothetical protein JL720_2795 [Aureococcus anophagefferens]
MTLLLRCAASAACAIAADWSAARHRVGTVGGPPLDAAAGNDLIRARLADRFAGRRGPFLVSRLALGAELGVALERAARARTSSDLGALCAASTRRRREAAAGGLRGGDQRDANPGRPRGRLRDRRGARGARGPGAAGERRQPRSSPSTPAALVRGARGRRVLVVHPFAATIRAQYAAHAAGRSLWADGDVLRPWTSSSCGRPCPSRPRRRTGPGPSPSPRRRRPSTPRGPSTSRSWAAAATASSRTVPSAAVAIVGGGLRVSSASRVPLDGAPFFAAAANEHWVWPAADETPPGAAGVEGAAYWRPP